MAQRFDLQGHRGARGLKPENTLSSFEAALDCGATSLETDLHLTRDGVVVLCHDARVTRRLFRRISRRVPAPSRQPLVGSLALEQLRGYSSSVNPDRGRFPDQDATPGPLAGWYAARHRLDPWFVPALADLFQFADDYAGPPGLRLGKTSSQRRRARLVVFDLELKRVPFDLNSPPTSNPGFTGHKPGLLETLVLATVRSLGLLQRTRVRSFDHRCVALLHDMEPILTGAVLVPDMAPVAPEEVALRAGARLYCPQYEFIDLAQVRRLQQAALRVIPWTVNDPEAWSRFLDWGVDGICTDFPDRLGQELRRRKLAF
jgi:glycerophosphoryl diester phosphodiesterase